MKKFIRILWRLLIVITAPVWAPVGLIGAIALILLIGAIGYIVIGPIHYIITGKFDTIIAG